MNITAVVLITFFNVFYCFREYLFSLSFSLCLMSLVALRYRTTALQLSQSSKIQTSIHINLCS